MPYLPYLNRKWKRLKRRCPVCKNGFDTHNPYKEYCSEKCRRIGEVNRRRVKNEIAKVNKAKLLTQTQREIKS